MDRARRAVKPDRRVEGAGGDVMVHDSISAIDIDILDGINT